jgi:hypothetical protein
LARTLSSSWKRSAQARRSESTLASSKLSSKGSVASIVPRFHQVIPTAASAGRITASNACASVSPAKPPANDVVPSVRVCRMTTRPRSKSTGLAG